MRRALLLARSYRNAIVNSPGLVGYWRLGEEGGTVALDETGRNHGTYVATPTLGAAGALSGDPNKAVTLDGGTEYISVADSTPFRFAGTAAFSLSLWMKHTADASFRRVISCENAAQKGWQINSQSGSWSIVRVGSTGGTQEAGSGTAGSGWVHVAATYNGTTLTLYKNGAVNGIPVASAASLPSDSTFKIGTFGGGSVAGFNGSLDEVAIVDRALTAAEIARLYQLGRGY